MRKSPAPSISVMPKPPPGVKTGNTVLCAVSLASSVVVIAQPLRITCAASLAITAFPRRMPCWSGNDRRTTSSACSSIHRSALAAASNCSSLHSPWRSTKLRAVRSSDDDTGFTPRSTHDSGAIGSRHVPAIRCIGSMQARRLRLQAGEQVADPAPPGAGDRSAAREARRAPRRPGAARAAVIALRHDDAVAGMGGRRSTGSTARTRPWLGPISLTIRAQRSPCPRRRRRRPASRRRARSSAQASRSSR